MPPSTRSLKVSAIGQPETPAARTQSDIFFEATLFTAAAASRAILLAHYDIDGVFDPYVVAALQQYRHNADQLTVVSASAKDLPASLKGIVDRFIPRHNRGYDFCSWRAGIKALGDPSQFDEIICVNDSVYGPLFDLSQAFSDPRLAAADLWGMVLSEQGSKRHGKKASCPHLQSWLFGMRRPLLESQSFGDFWESVVPLETKEAIVDRYEIGMSQHFERAGFRLAALYDARKHPPVSFREMWPHCSLWHPTRTRRYLRKARRVPHNPSELVWQRLLAAGVPFVKAGLFRVNHYGLNLEHVLNQIDRLSPADGHLIRHHLDRCRAN